VANWCIIFIQQKKLYKKWRRKIKIKKEEKNLKGEIERNKTKRRKKDEKINNENT
jgi:hypothetical protein